MSNDVVQEVLKIFNRGWNKQVILYGPPGTSKTYSATIIAAAMLAGCRGDKIKDDEIKDAILNKLQEEEKKECEDKNLYEVASEYLKLCKNNYKLVQFHPSYSYEDFVRGISVKAGGNGVTYEVEPKIIEKFCREKGTKVLVIDEINRAPLASVLGELIYGLEYRGEKISTSYELKEKNEDKSEEKTIDLVIPDDLYIIGTMNTADRSIGSMDYAVRRRFAFIQVGSVEDAILGSWGCDEKSDDSSVGKKALALYKKLMEEEEGIFSQRFLEDTELDVEDIKIGHTYFLGKKKSDQEYEDQDYLMYRINYQIRPIYNEYIKDGMIKKEGLDRFKEIVKEEGLE